ncbi:MAG: membrane protein insertase YidC, partial [Coriobacteriales bacterium]|nr:membrane protein insertase YidC [Coriobacteriales bacterium]
MGSILFDIIIQPIVLLIEFVFANATRAGGVPGVAIIFVSLAVNILCLPLYRMADAQQEKERERQKAMERWVTHIKRNFKGDERYMMLSAYYTIRGYRPAQALLGSLSLLLQIPFFMAAYSYLSNLEVLRGSSFLFLADLGAPDALLTLGGLTINLMPVAMTLFNCVSTAIYTRGLPARDKVQAYVLAALFLILLYDSPSGLVFYWTCNQIFSLGKNVVMKLLPHKEKPKRADKPASAEDRRRTNPAFFLAAALLTALLGILVPSAVIAASPTEFVNPLDAQNPLSYVL